MNAHYISKKETIITLSFALVASFILYVLFRSYEPLLVTMFIYMFLFSVLISYYAPEVFIGFFYSGFLSIFIYQFPALDRQSGWSLMPFFVVLFYLFRQAYHRNWSLKIESAFISQILFFLLMMVSIILYPTENGIKKTWHFTYHNLSPLLCVLAFRGNVERLKRTVYSFAFGTIIFSIFGTYSYSKGISLELDRMTALFWGSISFGRISAIAAIFTATYLVERKKTLKNICLFCPLYLLLLFNSIASGTRGVLLGLVFVHFLYILALGLKKKNYLLLFILPVFFSFSMYFIYTLVPENFTARITNAITSQESDTSISARKELYAEAWEGFKAQPFFGYGIGSFIYHSSFEYPHNIILEIAFELGFAGIICFLFFVGKCFSIGWKSLSGLHNTEDTGKIVSFFWFVFLFIEAQFSFDITGNLMLWFFGGLVVAYNVPKTICTQPLKNLQASNKF